MPHELKIFAEKFVGLEDEAWEALSNIVTLKQYKRKAFFFKTRTGL